MEGWGPRTPGPPPCLTRRRACEGSDFDPSRHVRPPSLVGRTCGIPLWFSGAAREPLGWRPRPRFGEGVVALARFGGLGETWAPANGGPVAWGPCAVDGAGTPGWGSTGGRVHVQGPAQPLRERVDRDLPMKVVGGESRKLAASFARPWLSSPRGRVVRNRKARDAPFLLPSSVCTSPPYVGGISAAFLALFP